MFFFSYIFVTVNQKTFYKFKTVTKMKKMIFTAMAVLAFSAVSVAKSPNSIAKNPQVMKKENKLSVKVAGPDCASHRFHTYIYARQAGLSKDQSSSVAYEAYFSCMSIM
jgi:hypothetical protein